MFRDIRFKTCAALYGIAGHYCTQAVALLDALGGIVGLIECLAADTIVADRIGVPAEAIVPYAFPAVVRQVESRILHRH